MNSLERLIRAPRGSSVRVNVSLSPAEAEAVKEAARVAGMETGAWLRLLALEGLRK